MTAFDRTDDASKMLKTPDTPQVADLQHQPEPEHQTDVQPAQLKAEIEAALFITGKALSLQELAELVNAPAEDVEMAVGELIQDYAFREGCGLEIDDTDGYILQVREDCSRIVHKMMPLEMSPAALRTLSAIAIKAPILQSDLIDLRGSSAYEHIAELLTRKLISKRRQGRSFVLNTTKSFNEYFKLAGDKKELEALVNRLKPEQASPDKSGAKSARTQSTEAGNTPAADQNHYSNNPLVDHLTGADEDHTDLTDLTGEHTDLKNARSA